MIFSVFHWGSEWRMANEKYLNEIRFIVFIWSGRQCKWRYERGRAPHGQTTRVWFVSISRAQSPAQRGCVCVCIDRLSAKCFSFRLRSEEAHTTDLSWAAHIHPNVPQRHKYPADGMRIYWIFQLNQASYLARLLMVVAAAYARSLTAAVHHNVPSIELQLGLVCAGTPHIVAVLALSVTFNWPLCCCCLDSSSLRDFARVSPAAQRTSIIPNGMWSNIKWLLFIFGIVLRVGISLFVIINFLSFIPLPPAGLRMMCSLPKCHIDHMCRDATYRPTSNLSFQVSGRSWWLFCMNLLAADGLCPCRE